MFVQINLMQELLHRRGQGNIFFMMQCSIYVDFSIFLQLTLSKYTLEESNKIKSFIELSILVKILKTVTILSLVYIYI